MLRWRIGKAFRRSRATRAVLLESRILRRRILFGARLGAAATKTAALRGCRHLVVAKRRCWRRAIAFDVAARTLSIGTRCFIMARALITEGRASRAIPFAWCALSVGATCLGTAVVCTRAISVPESGSGRAITRWTALFAVTITLAEAACFARRAIIGCGERAALRITIEGRAIPLRAALSSGAIVVPTLEGRAARGALSIRARAVVIAEAAVAAIIAETALRPFAAFRTRAAVVLALRTTIIEAAWRAITESRAFAIAARWPVSLGTTFIEAATCATAEFLARQAVAETAPIFFATRTCRARRAAVVSTRAITRRAGAALIETAAVALWTFTITEIATWPVAGALSFTGRALATLACRTQFDRFGRAWFAGTTQWRARAAFGAGCVGRAAGQGKFRALAVVSHDLDVLFQRNL